MQIRESAKATNVRAKILECGSNGKYAKKNIYIYSR